jgi:hypothetical protein
MLAAGRQRATLYGGTPFGCATQGLASRKAGSCEIVMKVAAPAEAARAPAASCVDPGPAPGACSATSTDTTVSQCAVGRRCPQVKVAQLPRGSLRQALASRTSGLLLTGPLRGSRRPIGGNSTRLHFNDATVIKAAAEATQLTSEQVRRDGKRRLPRRAAPHLLKRPTRGLGQGLHQRGVVKASLVSSPTSATCFRATRPQAASRLCERQVCERQVCA